MLENPDRYQKQRAVYAEKRRLYAKLSSLYHQMGQLYRELRTVHWTLNRYYRGDPNFRSSEREATQLQRTRLMSELTELSLQLQNLQAAIVELQRTNPTGIDHP